MKRDVAGYEVPGQVSEGVMTEPSRQESRQGTHARVALRETSGLLSSALAADGDIPYHDVSQGALQGMALLHPDGTIQGANPALSLMLGAASPEALCGLNIREVVTLQGATTWEALCHTCLCGATIQPRLTVQGMRRDGLSRWLHVALTLTARHGAPTILLSCLDVTERHQLAAQGSQQHKLHALGNLAGGIAHDFNNMLAAILGYADLLLGDTSRESLAWHRVQRILSAGERARELVRQILAANRQQAQERRPVQLGLVIEEVLKLLRAALPVTITLQQYVEPHVGTVLADSTQMYQVLMNLCVNAEHAMRAQGGVIDIRLEDVDISSQRTTGTGMLAPGPYIRLTVQDTGTGMTPDIMAQIFEPFFTTKAPEEGTGMGLAVVQSIVQSHDGVLTVSSSPGQGTTFAMYLPRFGALMTVPAAREESGAGEGRAYSPGG